MPSPPAERGAGRLRSRPCVGRWLAALVATGVLAMGCAADTAIPGQGPAVTISHLLDEPLGLRTAPGVELLAAFQLSSGDPRFGGFSAIETDGRTLWLLGDRAVLWQAALELDPRTGILDLADWQVGALVPDAEERRPLDSEALALAPDGTLYAAFEHDNSLRRLTPLPSGDWSTERLHAGPLVDGSPRNEGLEALARLPDGSLVALSEGARLAPGVALGVVLADSRPHTFGYAIGRGFKPVAAAATADGLYVLERSLGVLTGWQTRLTRSDLASLAGSGTLEGEELLRLTAGPLAENYEGLAILSPASGPRTILMISDDNQSALQRTLLLVFDYAG